MVTATATMSWFGCSSVEVLAPRQNHFEPAKLVTASLNSTNDQECLVKFRSDQVSEQVPVCDIVPMETGTSFWAVQVASLSLPNTFADLFGDGALCEGFKSSLRESNKQFLTSVDQSEDVPIPGKCRGFIILFQQRILQGRLTIKVCRENFQSFKSVEVQILLQKGKRCADLVAKLPQSVTSRQFFDDLYFPRDQTMTQADVQPN